MGICIVTTNQFPLTLIFYDYIQNDFQLALIIQTHARMQLNLMLFHSIIFNISRSPLGDFTV